MRNLKRFYSVAKIPTLYADACISKPKEYSNYKDHVLKFG